MDIHVDAFCQIVFMAGKTEWIAFANMQWSNRQYRPGWGMKLHADVLGLFGQEPGDAESMAVIADGKSALGVGGGCCAGVADVHGDGCCAVHGDTVPGNMNAGIEFGVT